MKNKVINIKDAPIAIGHYSQAIVASDGTLYSSGQLPIDPTTNTLLENDIESKTYQILKNLENILKANDMDLKNIVKATIYLTNMNDFSKVNKVYEDYLKETKPARTVIQVAALPKNSNIEIEIIAK